MKRDILHAGHGTPTAASHSRLNAGIKNLRSTAAGLAEPLIRWVDLMLRRGVPPTASVVLELARLADLDERVAQESSRPASRGTDPEQRSRAARRRRYEGIQQRAGHAKLQGQHRGPQH